MKGYPNWFVPALLGTVLVVFATGGLLAPTTLVLRAGLTLAWRLPGSARVVCAALHATGCFLLLLLIGALWSVHMRSGWRRRRQRASGLLLGLALMVLAASAIAIYYTGDDSLGTVAGLVHLGVGAMLVLPFGWHWLRGRRTAAGNKSPSDDRVG